MHRGEAEADCTSVRELHLIRRAFDSTHTARGSPQSGCALSSEVDRRLEPRHQRLYEFVPGLVIAFSAFACLITPPM